MYNSFSKFFGINFYLLQQTLRASSYGGVLEPWAGRRLQMKMTVYYNNRHGLRYTAPRSCSTALSMIVLT